MKNNMNYYNQNNKKRVKVKRVVVRRLFIIVLSIIIILIVFINVSDLLKTSSFPEDSISKEVKNEKNNDNNAKDNNASFSETVEKPIIKQIDWQVADENYFHDAIFVGDSRTEGFMLNNGIMADIKSYTHKGLTVDSIFTSRVINKNGRKITIMDALRESEFSKIYLMLGINETGWPYNDVFISHYAKVIDEIKKINPDCIIYIQSIIPVSEKVSSTHKYLKNSKIKEFNSLIEKMADEKQVYYLNVSEALVNDLGVLPEEAAVDGVHLNKEYCIKWFLYIKNHVIGVK